MVDVVKRRLAERLRYIPRIWVAAGIQAASVSSRDFRAILRVYGLTPDLSGDSRKCRAIRAYYFVVEKIGRLDACCNPHAIGNVPGGGICNARAPIIESKLAERDH